MTNLRTKLELGMAKAARDGFLYGMGYTKEEISRPYVAVVNSWNEYNVGHINLREIAERVKQGIREAGGLPFEVCTTGVCDGMVFKEPKYIELPSRNLVADEVELNVEGNLFDAMVLLCGCDSIVPGMLMGAARLDIPTIMVTSGYMPHGCYRGAETRSLSDLKELGKVQAGEVTLEEYEEYIASTKMGCGACNFMATGRSMSCVAEVLGLSLPGNSTMNASDKRLGTMGYKAGLRIMEMLEQGLTARKIITEKSIENAIMVDVALAGSTNLFIHIPAIAYEAGIDRDWWSYWDEVSHKIPLLLTVAPSGPYSFKDFDLAGGMKGLMSTLMPHLHKECLMVTGKTVGEEYEAAPVYNREVIHSLENPVSTDGGIAVLRGNIAPEGAVIKVAACPKNCYHFEGRAVVLPDGPSALQALKDGKFKAGDVIVVKYQGPKGNLSSSLVIVQTELSFTPLYDKVAIITDGRFSGGSHGLSIGYISPEAASGGPLAIVEDGDKVVIDIEKRDIHIEVSDEEINTRLKNLKVHKLDESKHLPMLRIFARNITSAAKGATWER